MAIDEHEDVARVLRSRPRTSVPPEFAQRVAARIDAEGQRDLLDSFNWRAWTWGLAPAAAALLVAAWLGIGATTSPDSSDDSSTTQLTTSVALLQPSTSGDALLEAVLTGADADPVEESADVR